MSKGYMANGDYWCEYHAPGRDEETGEDPYPLVPWEETDYAPACAKCGRFLPSTLTTEGREGLLARVRADLQDMASGDQVIPVEAPGVEYWWESSWRAILEDMVEDHIGYGSDLCEGWRVLANIRRHGGEYSPDELEDLQLVLEDLQGEDRAALLAGMWQTLQG